MHCFLIVYLVCLKCLVILFIIIIFLSVTVKFCFLLVYLLQIVDLHLVSKNMITLFIVNDWYPIRFF